MITILIGFIEFSSIGIGNMVTAFSKRHEDITKQYNTQVAAIYESYRKQTSILANKDLKE